MNRFNIFTQRVAVIALALTGSLIPMNSAKAANMHSIEYWPRSSVGPSKLHVASALQREVMPKGGTQN